MNKSCIIHDSLVVIVCFDSLSIFSSVFRNQGVSVGISRVSCAKLEMPSPGIEEDKAVTFESPQDAYDRRPNLKRFYCTARGSSNVFVVRHNFSSQAGAKSSGEEDELEDGFSELEMPFSAVKNQDGNVEDESDDELISEPELSDDGVDIEEPSHKELELLDTETNPSEKKAFKKRAQSALFNAILAAPGFSVHNALDKWVEEGHDLSRAEITLTVTNLRKRRMYGRALQVNLCDLIFT
jgi:hypothetical protein